MKRWTKPGVKTTEFWGAVGLSIGQMTKVLALPAWTMPIVWAVYAITRGMAKFGGPEIDDEK